MPASVSELPPPRFSVVIPSFNRPDRLRECLSAIAGLDRADPAFEVVVVDDGSREPLEPQVRDALDGLDVRFVRQENRGPAAARNAGARVARGEFLAFTDDDCRPEPLWLSALSDTLSKAPDALVGGYVPNALRTNVFAQTSQDLVDYLNEYFGAEHGSAQFFTSNNLACRRERFLALGGFDESFPLAAGEDREFGMRWRDRGGPLLFAPAAVVSHAHDLSLARFWRQHANYGRGAHHLHRVRAFSGRRAPKLESARFYLGLMGYPLKKTGPRRLTRAALMLLSQIAMVAGYGSAIRGSMKDPGCGRAARQDDGRISASR